MKYLKKIFTVLVCIALLMGALYVSLKVTGDPGASAIKEKIGPVIISEILSANMSYPGPAGELLDYIELQNISDSQVDISGFMLSDDLESIGYTFPKGTVLDPGGYILCWCSREKNSEEYAAFGISRLGDDTICLYNSANVLLDQVDVPSLNNDQPLQRNADGTWKTDGLPSPGYANTQEGYMQWQQSRRKEESLDVRISEVMSGNRSTYLNKNGKLCDWVELENYGTVPVDLTGAFLSDNVQERGKWRISKLILQPGERAIIPCVGLDAQEGEATFKLRRSGTDVILTSANGTEISKISVPPLEYDCSWAVDSGGEFFQTDLPSPGFENTGEGHAAYLAAQHPQSGLVISEVLTSNSGYLLQADGKYYDIVELMNRSEKAVSLAQFYLSNDPEALMAYQLPDISLAAGERIVLICSGYEMMRGQYHHLPMTLDAQEDWLYLTNSAQVIVDRVHLKGIPIGGSMGRNEDQDLFVYFQTPTPGRPNGQGAALSALPKLMADGVYRVNTQLMVQGSGELHYTTDGSIPDAEDPILVSYQLLTQNTVLRVINIEEGKLPSPPVTGVYLIEEHTIPVISIAADPEQLFGKIGILEPNYEDREILCNFKFLDKSCVSADCGVEVSGRTMAEGTHKSLKLNFRSRYGSRVFCADIFGGGTQIYGSLILSSCGTDETLLRQALMSALAQDMESAAPVARQRFCVLYLNGNYWGIYSVQENLNEDYLAHTQGVRLESVTHVKQTQKPNPDSLIDYMILQGYGSCSNLAQNREYLQSTELSEGAVRLVTELNGSFREQSGFAGVLMLPEVASALQEESFQQAFAARMESLQHGPLSQNNALAILDTLVMQLEPEIERHTERWGGSKLLWQADVARLRGVFVYFDHWGMLKQSLKGA